MRFRNSIVAFVLAVGTFVTMPTQAAWYSIHQFAPHGDSRVVGMTPNNVGGMHVGTDAGEQFEWRTVQSFDGNGNYLKKVGQAEAPNDVAVTAAGNVLLADGFAQGVWEFTPAGSSVRTYEVGQAGLGGLMSVATSAGSVWATRGTNQIYRFNSATGQSLGQITIPGITQHASGTWNAYPSDILVTDAGVIYVALAEGIIGPNQGNKILALSLTGTLLGQTGSGGSGPGQFDFSYGSSLALQGGSLAVADTGNSRVQLLNAANGQFIEQFGSLGTGVGQLTNPRAIGFDDNGNIWVGDAPNGAGRIQIFSTVPEPATVVLGALGGVALLVAARRRVRV